MLGGVVIGSVVLILGMVVGFIFGVAAGDDRRKSLQADERLVSLKEKVSLLSGRMDRLDAVVADRQEANREKDELVRHALAQIERMQKAQEAGISRSG